MRRKEEKQKATLTTQGMTNVLGMAEHNAELKLIVRRKVVTTDEVPREKLFVVKLQVKMILVDAIVDS